MLAGFGISEYWLTRRRHKLAVPVSPLFRGELTEPILDDSLQERCKINNEMASVLRLLGSSATLICLGRAARSRVSPAWLHLHAQRKNSTAKSAVWNSSFVQPNSYRNLEWTFRAQLLLTKVFVNTVIRTRTRMGCSIFARFTISSTVLRLVLIG